MFQVDDKPFTVEVIDSVADYVEFMKEIFDFSAIKAILVGSEGRAPVPILLNGLNGGDFTKHVFFFNIM